MKNKWWFQVIIFWFFCALAVLVICYFFPAYSKDPNLKKTIQGQTSKIDYQGHSYIVWSVNFGGGIVHDPDCQCHIKE